LPVCLVLLSTSSGATTRVGRADGRTVVGGLGCGLITCFGDAVGVGNAMPGVGAVAAGVGASDDVVGDDPRHSSSPATAAATIATANSERISSRSGLGGAACVPR
jgi:hypothetical protein